MANLVDIQGIDVATAERLMAAGVLNTDALLEQGGTPGGRDRIAQAAGLSPARLLHWVNHADLYRISGVAGQFAELLEAAGVDSVLELARRDPDHLAAKLAEVNGQKNLANRTPSPAECARWIEEAKDLPRMVTH